MAFFIMSDVTFTPDFDPFFPYQQRFAHITDVVMPMPFTLRQSEYNLSSQTLVQWQLGLIIPHNSHSPKKAAEKACQPALKSLQNQ